MYRVVVLLFFRFCRSLNTIRKCNLTRFVKNCRFEGTSSFDSEAMTHIRGIPPINMGEGLRILGETFDSQGFPNTQTYDEAKHDFHIIRKELEQNGLKITYEEGNHHLIVSSNLPEASAKVMIELIQDDKNGLILGDMTGKAVKATHYVELTRKGKDTKALIKVQSTSFIESEFMELNLVKKDGDIIKSPEIPTKDPELKEAIIKVLSAYGLTPSVMTQIIVLARLGCAIEQTIWGEEMRTFTEAKTSI